MTLVLVLLVGMVLGSLLLLVGFSVGRSMSRSTLEASHLLMASNLKLASVFQTLSSQAAQDWRVSKHLEDSMTYFQQARDRTDRLAEKVLLMDQTLQEIMLRRRSPVLPPARTTGEETAPMKYPGIGNPQPETLATTAKMGYSEEEAAAAAGPASMKGSVRR